MLMSEWKKAIENLEGIRPYEDGYNKESIHRLIVEGNKLLAENTKLTQKLEAIWKLVKYKHGRIDLIQIKKILGVDGEI